MQRKLIGATVTKAVIMAGGSGSRMWPSSLAVSKHLIPLFDKPIIFYPISVAMLAGARDLIIVCRSSDIEQYQAALAEAKYLNIEYLPQENPNGVAEGIKLAAPLIGDNNFLFVLGDNLFFGSGLSGLLERVIKRKKNTIFGYQVKDPKNYGVVTLGQTGRVIEIVEKPEKPKSNLIATGLYFYTYSVFEQILKLTPSKRGELEISELNQRLIKKDDLALEILGRGYSWMDCGTPDRVFEAASFVKSMYDIQGYNVACLEEIALSKGWLSKYELKRLPQFNYKSSYGQYLRSLAEDM